MAVTVSYTHTNTSLSQTTHTPLCLHEYTGMAVTVSYTHTNTSLSQTTHTHHYVSNYEMSNQY